MGNNYVAPQIEVIEIEIEGVLCTSGDIEGLYEGVNAF